MEDGKYVDGSFYFYAPNKAAPAFFAAAFAISGLIHIYQCYHYKCWPLTPFFPFCAVLFAAGFAVREYGTFHYSSLDVYIASTCLIYASPPLLELANYHILGRILYFVPYHSPIHAGRVLSTFAFLSGIVEALNGLGASFSANQSLAESRIEAGHAIIKTALPLQLVVAAAFMALIVTFHSRCNHGAIKHRSIQQPLFTLYISIFIILIRTIYRIVEYFGIAELKFGEAIDRSTITPVVRYEWFFMVFEATLMLVNLVLWNFRHPRIYLPNSNMTYLARDGKTEVAGPGWKDPRPFWQTVIDPFDFIHLVRKNRDGFRGFEKFWENDGLVPATNAAENGASHS